MNLYSKLQQRAADNKPIRIGLIGAGKFGSMYLAQIPKTPGVHLVAIADLSPDAASTNLARVGWNPALAQAESAQAAIKTGATWITDDWQAVVTHPQIDIIVECTGNPVAAVEHCLKAFAHGKLPHFSESTPDTVWGNYGLTPEQAVRGGLNPKMFNSFLDGSKPSIECTAVANATGLTVPGNGLLYPPASVEDIPFVTRPIQDGGVLERKGMVEVISSLEADGRKIPYDIRMGVWVTVEAETDYIKNCFEEYNAHTDPSGRYFTLYKRWHLIGLEVGVSVASVALRGEPTGVATCWNADVVATAKRDLKPGDMLDGEGGYTVWGK
ncbi:MAG: hypothetical protein B7Y42_16060, partial [Polaromonas sp. 28-63-22]